MKETKFSKLYLSNLWKMHDELPELQQQIKRLIENKMEKDKIPNMINDVITEVNRISTEEPVYYTPIQTLRHVLEILEKRRLTQTGLGAPIVLLKDAIERLENESNH